MTVNISFIIAEICELFFSVYGVAVELWELFNTPIVSIATNVLDEFPITNLIPAYDTITLIVEWLGRLAIGNVTILQLMCGSGISLFIGYVVVTWILNVWFG